MYGGDVAVYLVEHVLQETREDLQDVGERLPVAVDDLGPRDV